MKSARYAGSLFLVVSFFVSSTALAAAKPQASQIILTKPAAVVVGDVLVASIALEKETNANVSAPAGWQLIRRTNQGDGIALLSYWKTASTSEPFSYIWTIDAKSVQDVGGITRYSGIDTTNPIDMSGSASGNGKVATAPSITTNAAGEKVIALFATDKKGHKNGFSVMSGMTTEYATSTKGGPMLMAEDMMQATSGPAGAISSTFAKKKSHDWVGQVIALRPKSQTRTITLDATATNGAYSSSVSIPLTAAANTLIIVGCENQGMSGSSVTATWAGNAMTKDAEAVDSGDNASSLFSFYNTTAQTANAVCAATGVAYVAGVAASFLGAKNAHAFATDSAEWSDAETSRTSTIDTTGHPGAMHIVFSYDAPYPAPGNNTQMLATVDSQRTLWSSNPLSILPAGINTLSFSWSTGGGGTYASGAYDVAP